MVFTRACTSSVLHDEWDITYKTPIDKNAPLAIKDKLLELSNKKMHLSAKRNAKFCHACVGIVKRDYPQLVPAGKTRDKTSDESDDSHESHVTASFGETIDETSLPSTSFSEPARGIKRGHGDENSSSSASSCSDEGPSPSTFWDVSKMSPNQRAELAYNLAKFEQQGIKKQALSLSQCRDLESLTNLDTTSANPTISAFLQGIQDPSAPKGL